MALDLSAPTDHFPAPETDPSAADDPRRGRRHWLRWTLLVVGLLVLVAGVGGAVWGMKYDRAHRDELLPGVMVGGVPAGDMAARTVVGRFESRLATLGATTIPLSAPPAQGQVTLTQLGLRSDAAAAVGRAQDRAREMGLPRRLWHRLLDKPVRQSYPVRFRVERAAAARAVAGLAGQVELAPVDASIDTSSGFVTIRPAADGRTLDQATASRMVFDRGSRLARGEAASGPVVLPVLKRDPAVRGYADVILVRKGENRLYHYEDGGLAKSYAVATGTAEFPTPQGRFKIVAKRRNPTWINPDPTGWGASMPRRIGPGPDNPLGTRAMNLNSPGIRIHGTRNVASLGTPASHGCIRMSIAESEELFGKVTEGTPVVVIQAG